MEETRKRQELTGRIIKEIISEVTSTPKMCGFEVYVITKVEPRLKKMGFVEKEGNNLRHKLKDAILKSLHEKFNSPDAYYEPVERIADEQRKIYIIPTSEQYDPFSVLKTTAGMFEKKDLIDATGIAFLIRKADNCLWAYQHLWNIMVPNKSGKNFMAKLISSERDDVFEEMADPIITFSEKIDLLIIDNYIVTSNYNLLQNSFGFQDYIRLQADKTIAAIEGRGIVANVDKLRDYIDRGNGKIRYAKKMMRVTDSKVLKLEPYTLWENIHKSIRWNGKIKEENGRFILNNYSDVENLIDLLDERYTRSEITGAEYDTDVKQDAKSVLDIQ